MRDSIGAFGLALLVHAALIGVLMLNVDWTPKVQPVVPPVNIVQAKAIDVAKVEAELQRRRDVEREKRLQAERKRQQAEQARQRKLELAQRKKLEAERKHQAELARKQRLAAERKQKQVEAARKQAEAARKKQAEAERQRQQEEERQRKAEQERQRQEAERQRQADLQAALAEEEDVRRRAEEQRRQQALEQQRQAEEHRLQQEADKYTSLIQRQVTTSWLRPATVPAGLKCLVRVKMIPGGDVIDVQVIKGSGNPVFDRSVVAAVRKAAPLKVPSNLILFNRHFRELNIEFNPED